MTGRGRRRRKRETDHLCSQIIGNRRNARWPCPVPHQAVHALMHEALLPAPHPALHSAGRSHDRVGTDALGAQQNDTGPPDMLLRGVAISDHRFQTLAVCADSVEVMLLRMPQARTRGT